MNRIRHVALLAKDPEALGKFYVKTFGMKDVHRGVNGTVYLSDGHVNLAIVPARDQPEGIFHFGFQVDDKHAVAESAFANGAPEGLHDLNIGFVESYIHDPIGQRVDLSEEGWKI
jgi:catechol 2,3-dioxygenase-like lactoylglutathione lyase family enzyme